MKNANRTLSCLAAATALAVICGSTAQAQYYPPLNAPASAYAAPNLSSVGGARAPASAAQGPVIQIHHHHYYYQPAGGLSPLIAQQGDPAMAGGAGYLGARPDGGAAPTAFGGSWGDLGLYGYMGQQGQQSGLIVSRVAPNTPASQLGLIAGDIILDVNDQDLNDMTTRQQQVLFLSLTTESKKAVTMQVWNSHTQRTSTLKAVFEDKAVDKFNDESDDAP